MGISWVTAYSTIFSRSTAWTVSGLVELVVSMVMAAESKSYVTVVLVEIMAEFLVKIGPY